MATLQERMEVAQRIEEIRRSIKRKHSALTKGFEESEREFRTRFKPLIEPLTKFTKTDEEGRSFKTEIKDEDPSLEQSPFGAEYDSRELVMRGKRFRPRSLMSSTVLYPDRRPRKDKSERVRKAAMTSDDDDAAAATTPLKMGRSELDEPMDVSSSPDDGRIYNSGDEPMEDDRPQPLSAIKRVTRAHARRAAEDVYESPTPIEEFLSSPENRLNLSDLIKRQFRGPLAREYLLGLYNDTKNLSDTVYGVYIGRENGQPHIGDSVVTFNADDTFLIGDRKFPAERGLYELMFKKRPDPYLYSAEDLKDYKAILLATNAHKVNNAPTGRVKSNSGPKYTNIVKSLMADDGGGGGPSTSSSRKGKGLKAGAHMVLNGGGGKVDYVYWDDPNELCDRLRLLIAEKDAGHTGHNNEIVSIVEELTERGVIKGVARAL